MLIQGAQSSPANLDTLGRRTLKLKCLGSVTQEEATVPHRYAILIGISNYQRVNSADQFEFPESDADVLYRVLISQEGGALASENVHLLKCSPATLAVVRFLLDPSLPYAPPAPAPPPPAPVGQPAAPSKPEIRMPPKVYPRDTHAADIPAEPGLYGVLDGIPQKTDLKLLLGEKQGPGVGKVMMKKGKAVGYLLGPASKTRVKESTATFYLRLPEGKMIEETKGEYLFFLLGSAEPPKGIFGKGYDFGVDAAAKQ